MALRCAVDELQRSAWPEVVQRWSRLTPSGFPVEVTVGGAVDAPLRWTCEVAGPEADDASRLGRVAARLAAAGQVVASPLLDALQRLQHDRELRYGAWLGGRDADSTGASRLKLYAEVPAAATLDALRLPAVLRDILRHAPAGAQWRMLGVEPARNRVELYLRLPLVPLDDLRPLLHAAGQPRALETLDRCLPDGLRRLAGRRLGISFAIAAFDERVDVALFASARTLFPGAPEALARLVPRVAGVPATLGRCTLVTIGLEAERDNLSCAVGMTVR